MGIKSFFANLSATQEAKAAAKALAKAPLEKATDYANELNGSLTTKQNAYSLMRQGYTTDQAVTSNLDKAEARKKAEADDKAAQEKLTTDLEALAAGILTKVEKTKELNAQASVLAEENKAVNDVLKATSFAEILAATKAAKEAEEAKKAAAAKTRSTKKGATQAQATAEPKVDAPAAAPTMTL